MFTNQRKMMRPTRNSQWRHQQQQKLYQSQGAFFQRNWKHHSTTMKARKMMELEKIMFHDEFAELQFKVVSNPLILKTILFHMSFSDLKTTRLVCKDWKKLANLELKRRKCCKSNGWDLDPTFQVMRKSEDMSWIEFDCQYLDQEQLTKFASVSGHQVKMMKFRPSQTFWDLLNAGKFPNLEILRSGRSITTTTTTRNSNKESSSNDSLLTKAAPNLQRIEGIHLSEAFSFPSEIFGEKNSLIKSVKLDWNEKCCSSSLDQITLLAQAKPKLERFDIEKHPSPENSDSELLKQIYSILESSRESLQTLKMYFANVPFKLPQSQSQPFQRLSTLHLHILLSNSFLIKFLESCRQNSVPNLKTVKFDFKLWYQVVPDSDCFSPDNICEGGVLSSVVNLEIFSNNFFQPHDFLPSKWFPWLSTLFPNVQHLIAGNWKDMDEVLLHVFPHWPKLAALTIQKLHKSFYYADPKFDLDPVLTGLSLEKCEELRKMDPHNMKMNMMTEETLKCRTWPNLFSLKGLKRLDIFVVGYISPPFSCPVSLVSFICAINLKSELKATIHFPKRTSGFREFLEPLKPYARLEKNTKQVWSD